MLIIEDIDSLKIGIEKIEENLNFLTKISNSNTLIGQDQKDLNLSINEFTNNLNKLKLLTNNYNIYDSNNQQKIMDVAFDLYNDVNYLKDILNNIDND